MKKNKRDDQGLLYKNINWRFIRRPKRKLKRVIPRLMVLILLLILLSAWGMVVLVTIFRRNTHITQENYLLKADDFIQNGEMVKGLHYLGRVINLSKKGIYAKQAVFKYFMINNGEYFKKKERFGGASFIDQKKMLTWSENGQLKVRNLQSGQLQQSLDLNCDIRNVYQINKSTFLIWSQKGFLRLWNTTAGSEITKPEYYLGRVDGWVVSDDQKHVLVWDNRGEILIWSTNINFFDQILKLSRPVDPRAYALSKYAFTPLSLSEKGRKNPVLIDLIKKYNDHKTWDQWEGQVVSRYDYDGYEFLDNDTLLTYQDKITWLWDVSKENEKKQYLKKLTHKSTVRGTLYSQEQNLIISWTNTDIYFWDLVSGKLLSKKDKITKNIKEVIIDNKEARIGIIGESKGIFFLNIEVDYDLYYKYLSLIIELNTGTKLNKNGEVVTLSERERERKGRLYEKK